MFLHVESTQTLRVDNPCFFQMTFFYQMCTILLKIGEDFNIDDYKEKGLELMNFFFTTHFIICF